MLWSNDAQTFHDSHDTSMKVPVANSNAEIQITFNPSNILVQQQQLLVLKSD